MKKIMILIFFVSTGVNGQIGKKIGQKAITTIGSKPATEKTDNSINMGAIDTYKKTYENQKAEAEKFIQMNKYKMAVGKIQAMANSLEKMKKADPSGNYSQQEAEINALIQKTQSGNKNMLAERQAKSDSHYERIENEDYVSTFIRSIEPTKEMIENVKKVDISKIDLNKFKEDVLSNANNIDFVVKTLKRDLDNGQSHAIDRYESIQQYWEISSKFYPNEAKVTAAKSKVEALKKDVGFTSKEDYFKNMTTKQNAALANKTMNPAVRNDKAVEVLFTQAFNKESKAKNWDRTLLKVNLRSNDWQTKYHKVTGTILGRMQYACVAYKDNTTGKCQMSREYEIYQEYTGSGYSSNTIGGYGTSSTEILCENVK